MFFLKILQKDVELGNSSLIQFLTKTRLDKAKSLLQTTDFSITDEKFFR